MRTAQGDEPDDRLRRILVGAERSGEGRFTTQPSRYSVLPWMAV